MPVKKAKAAPKAKPAKATAKPGSFVITMLLDESGSMGMVAPQTISGFNEYVTALQKEESDVPTYFSAIKFDSRGVRILQKGVKLANAITLSSENYQPMGGTPLLDAIGRTIQATDEVAGKEMADKIVLVIQTDGAENESREFDIAKIKGMIEERQAKGWQFVFIGAGINAFADATRMGIAAVNTMSYGRDAKATAAMFAATASNTAGLRSGSLTGMGYSMTQSMASGEDAAITSAKLNLSAKASVKKTLESSLSLGDLNLGKGN